MKQGEKRQSIRLDSLNLLDYIVIDSYGIRGRYSMGRTLDISEKGMKLETNQSLSQGDSLIVTIGLEDNLVDVHGEVTYTRPKSGWYINGIEFVDVSDEGQKIIHNYMKAFFKSIERANDPE